MAKCSFAAQESRHYILTLEMATVVRVDGLWELRVGLIVAAAAASEDDGLHNLGCMLTYLTSLGYIDSLVDLCNGFLQAFVE